MKIPLEILRSQLESARHSIGHAMAHAAQGYTIEAEKDLSLAIEYLEAAQRMFSENSETQPSPKKENHSKNSQTK